MKQQLRIRTMTAAEAAEVVRRSAYLVDANRTPCPTCQGTGRAPAEGMVEVVHTRRAGIGADNPLTEVLAELETAERIIHRDSTFGPVIFAQLPGGRAVAVDVAEGPAPVEVPAP